MALEGNQGRLNPDLIPHSDRGVQYCCRDYISLLTKTKIAISMTQSGDPYENALAERVNRTSKEEMLQNRGFPTFETAQVAVKRAVESYNILRPHGRCDYYTPKQAHQMKGELGRRWRKSRHSSTDKMQSNEIKLTARNRT